MSGDELKKQIKEWAKRVGQAKANATLVGKGIGLSTTEKLVRGTYEPEPKARLREALESALAGETVRTEAS